MKDTGTITITELVTVHLEGYEPIKDLRKVSEWNGMWELRGECGAKVIISVDQGGFSALFGGLFADPFGTPREIRVVTISPSLLVPEKPKAAPAPQKLADGWYDMGSEGLVQIKEGIPYVDGVPWEPSK